MQTIAVTEVVQDVLLNDPEYEFPDIVKQYYDEEVQVLEFPWDRRARLGIKDSSLFVIEAIMGEEDQQSY